MSRGGAGVPGAPQQRGIPDARVAAGGVGVYRTAATTERQEEADGVINHGSRRLARRVQLASVALLIGDNHNVQSLTLFSGPPACPEPDPVIQG